MVITRLTALFIFLAVALVFPGITAAAEAVSPAASRLVELIKPHESESLAVRFMVAVSPIALPDGVAGCIVSKATPALKGYFAGLYAKHLSEAELQDAVDFFESKEGRAVVELRLQHEQDVYSAAARLETVAGEYPEYPPQVRKALEAFTMTAAGRVVTGQDEVASKEPYRGEISGLRDAAFSECIQELAAGKSGKSGAPIAAESTERIIP